MQLKTLPDPKVINVEAQENGELMKEEFPSPIPHKTRSRRITSLQCEHDRSCACDKFQRIEGPTVLQGVFGSLLIKEPEIQ